MPKGRPRKNPLPEITPEEQVFQEQTAVTEAEQQTTTEAYASEFVAQEMAAETAAPIGPERAEQPDSLLGYMAETFSEDIRSFMQKFGITGHPEGDVLEAVTGLANQIQGGQSSAETHAADQEQIPAPDPQQAEQPNEVPVPLNVRINSLELDGDTRAFATAEYGDLSIRRIRVKEDGYGTLSVTMPKYRQPGGWTETCRFDSVESRNRLTSAVLAAYGQKLAQLQGLDQAPSEAQAAGEVEGYEQEMEDEPALDEMEQDGPAMGMSL